MSEDTTVKPVEKKGRYTEQQLLDRHIGKNINQKEDEGWTVKRNTYKELGVYTAFNKLRDSLMPLLTDYKKYINFELMNQVAVIMMDTYLIRQSRGEDVEVPQPVVPLSAAVATGNGGKVAESGSPVMPLFDMAEFGDKADAGIDTFKDLNWIYKHIAVKGLKPADAPSPGAFAHLQYIQLNEQNMLDFYTKVYPRLIPAKSQLDNQKYGDDNRTTFDLLERLSRESTNSPG